MNGRNITEEIRSLDVTKRVSEIAKIPGIRKVMLDMQRQMAKKQGVVMDGRDIGSTVLPDAKYKFYLTADLKERAKRRYDELLAKGQKVSQKQIEKDIVSRDRMDKERAYSPLVIAPEAVIIDSTSKTIEEVVEDILDNIKRGESIAL